MHRNRLLAATACGLLAIGGVLVLRHAPAAPVPADPALQTVAFGAGDTRRDTKPFSMLGATWADPRSAVDSPIEVRTRSAATGKWSPWQGLEADGSQTGDARGSTDPLWVGVSDGVEARLAKRHTVVPAGLRLDLINTTGPAYVRPESTPVALEQHTTRSGSVFIPARPIPPYVSRAGWGANEGMVKGSPDYTGPSQVFFVHHTATGNAYSCADSASIVRGIEAYQVGSKGWNDIGYNFLVDKCGRVFEGRAGGATRNVLGAHTLGFNTDATAIAVIGNYDSVGITPAVRNAIAALAAYKLGSNSPAGRVTVTSGGSNRFPRGSRPTLYRISGHRDTARTDCPGNALEAQLPQIRAVAAAAPYGLRLLSMGGTRKVGTVYYTRGSVNAAWAISTPTSMLSRFEVWVDGALRVAPTQGARTASIELTPGVHTVALSAVHLNGKRAITSVRVIADVSAPVFTAHPDVALRSGYVSGSLPVRVGWNAADPGGIAAFQVTGTSAAMLGPTARGWAGAMPAGEATAFTVRAADRAGNVASAGVTRTGNIANEASSARTGTWLTGSNPSYLGGTALAGTAGATATYTFTGRAAGLIFGRNPSSGQVRVTVDGHDEGALDLRWPGTVYRQLAWTRYWSTPGTHTIKVQEVGAPVILDGLATLS